MTRTDRATRHVVDRCPSCGVEHDVRAHACEACDTPLRPWCRVHGREIGWLDGPRCRRCAQEAARRARPARARPAAAAAPAPPAARTRPPKKKASRRGKRAKPPRPARAPMPSRPRDRTYHVLPAADAPGIPPETIRVLRSGALLAAGAAVGVFLLVGLLHWIIYLASAR